MALLTALLLLMAINLSENFDAGQAAFDAAWTNDVGLNYMELRPGGCNPNGYLVSCNQGHAFHALTVAGGTVAFRARVSTIIPSSSQEYELAWLHFPGLNPGCNFIYAVGLRGDGKFFIRINDVSSQSFSTNDDLFPRDGTFFALQWRITQTSAYSASLVVEVNNVVVWSTSYDWTVYAGVCALGGTSSFFRVNLFTFFDANVKSAIDTVEVDDSAAHVDWGLCSAISIDAECNITEEDVACPDPCADAGIGEPYLVLAAEQNSTLFYDRGWNFLSSISTPYACALAPSSDGVWICMDDNVGGTSILYLVDPSTIDPNTTENEILRGPYTTEVRIAELGGYHALFVLDCDRLLTVDRTTHELIAICLPSTQFSGVALVETRYGLVVDPLDGYLVDGGLNVLYLDGGSAKLWNLKNDALLRTIGAVAGTWPVVTTNNQIIVRDANEILVYTRNAALVQRRNWAAEAPSVALSRLYGLAADLETDACSCGNVKDGGIFIPGETPATGITLALLGQNALSGGPPQATHIITLSNVSEGGINTASAFTILTPSLGGSFSDQTSGSTGTRRPVPNRQCGPEVGISSPTPNPGCNAGGKGWTRTYTGASGTVPDAEDPSGEETLTGKTDVFVRVKVRHTNYPSGTEEVLCMAKVDLPAYEADPDTHPHAEPRVLSIGDDDRGLSDGQGNLVSGSTHIQFMDGAGQPFGVRLRSATRKYWTRDELILEAITPEGLASGATPRRIGTGLVYGEDYGGPRVFGLTAVDPLFVEGGSFGPDKKVPQWTFPLAYYTNAPADLAHVPMPIIYGEVSDEGAISPITGLANSRGKCPVRFVGMDVLGTAPGGAVWGRFNICLFAIYDVIALYGSDLGGLGLYGSAAVVSIVETSDSEDATATTEAVQVALDGSPDLSGVATDGTMQLVLFTTSGRTESVITAVDTFAGTVSIESTVDPSVAAGVPWYISSIDYVPRRVKIDLATRNGVDVQVPTWAGYIRPTSYEDFTSGGTDYRVTDMWATGALLSAHLSGEVTLAVNVIGIEDQGDGSGLPITDYYTAFNHFMDNCIHVQAPKPQGGAGLWPQTAGALPAFSDGFSKTKQSSFADAQEKTVRSLGGRGLQVSAWFGEGISTRDALQQWVENSGGKAGTDEYGRFYVWVLDRYEDTSSWPRISHVNRVFADPPHRMRALDEACNSYRGGCDVDWEAGQFREDDLKAVSPLAITRNKGIVRFSKHYDLRLLADVDQAQWILDRLLLVNQDGPTYIEISGLDWGLLDTRIGSGFFFTSQMLPGTDDEGMVDQPVVILHRNFDIDGGLVSVVCLDLGQEGEGAELLIPSARRMIATDIDALAPLASDVDAIAPVAA